MPGTSGTILTLSAQALALVLAGIAGAMVGTTAGVVVGTTVGTMVGATAGTTAGAEVTPTSTARQLGVIITSTTQPTSITTTMRRLSLTALAD